MEEFDLNRKIVGWKSDTVWSQDLIQRRLVDISFNILLSQMSQLTRLSVNAGFQWTGRIDRSRFHSSFKKHVLAFAAVLDN